MTEDFEKEERIAQIRKELELRETEDLLAIWKAHDRREWSTEAFTAVERILQDRLGSLPPPKVEQPASEALDDPQRVEEARQSLAEADYFLDEGDAKRALQASQEAIRSAPHLAEAYNLQGLAYDEMGQLEDAIASYREALRLDPGFGEARENLREAQRELNQIEWDPQTDRHLELAIALVDEDELERALSECDLAIEAAPGYAPAQNYKGMILEELERFEEAIEAYRSAVQLDPEFYAARENLCNARLYWRDEQYRLIAQGDFEVQGEAAEYQPPGDMDDELSLDEIPYQGPHDLEPYDLEAPAYYLDGKSMLLPGWPGYRTRPGRSGYDYLDVNYEWGHMQGVLIRALFTGRLRTHNPIYLLLMVFVGVLYTLPGFLIFLSLRATVWHPIDIIDLLVICFLPIPIGIALLANLWLSLTSWVSDGQGFITGVES